MVADVLVVYCCCVGDGRDDVPYYQYACAVFSFELSWRHEDGTEVINICTEVINICSFVGAGHR